MSRAFISRVTRMSAAELRWRSACLARTAAQRTAARLRGPSWRRERLAACLSHGDRAQAVQRALRRHDWPAAHAAVAEAITQSPPSFLIAPAMRRPLAARIIRACPDAAGDAAGRADRIIAGEYDLLGYRGLRFDADRSAAPDWHLDPVHARRPPLRFWSTVPYLDPSSGDHKIIWELNRHQHLLVLGRAYWLTGDTRYRDGAIAHITGWIDANPPLMGINWASMLELGFRCLSWIWATAFFAGEPHHHEPPWLVDLLLALDRQLTHIEQNLSHYFSPNTHLLGEALALYVAGRALPLLGRAERCSRTGRAVLVAQIDRQIGRDGGHLERSTHYHRYTLDFYLLALTVARLTDDPVADRFEEAVGRLAPAARLLADDEGRLPHIGDDDGGMLWPACGRAADDLRDSLATASALLGRPALRVGEIPEETVWMLAHPALEPLLEPALDRLPSVAPPGAVRSGVLPDMGYYVSRSADGTHLVVDAGRHGYENGGHAHADALSLTLSVGGLPLLIDPGTGCYTTDPDMRDRFRSSMLHNTLVLDGRSQSIAAGPFHWASAADAALHAWRSNSGFDYLEASHDGYAPASHRRHVLALHGDLIVVADLVDGSGTHDVQVHWHVDPRWEIRQSGRLAEFRASGRRITLAVSHGSLEVVRGGDSVDGVGWHAPVYGRIEPAAAVRVATSGTLPLWVFSVFGLDPANDVRSVEPIPVWAHAGALARSSAVRITRAHSVDICGLAATAPTAGAALGGTWRVGGFETDARMLFCRSGQAVSRVALVDGSLLRGADRHALDVQLPCAAPDLFLELSASGTESATAHLRGAATGAHVHLAGRAVPVSVEHVDVSVERTDLHRITRPREVSS